MKFVIIDRETKVLESSKSDFVKRLLDLSGNRKTIPPLSVINEMLETGENNMGMSGIVKWEPISLSSKEYRNFCIDIEKLGWEVSDVPIWVKSVIDWHAWELEAKFGIPAKKKIELTTLAQKYEKKRDEAYIENNIDEARVFELKANEVQIELMKLINSYRKNRE